MFPMRPLYFGVFVLSILKITNSYIDGSNGEYVQFRCFAGRRSI